MRNSMEEQHGCKTSSGKALSRNNKEESGMHIHINHAATSYIYFGHDSSDRC
jgi:hypothetical protein